MSEIQFADERMLYALWLVPALAALVAYAFRRRREALARFVEAGLLARLGESSVPDPSRRFLKAALVLTSVGFLIVALARPAWDRVTEEVTERGRDVVFLLDVSRSMLAEDLPPNRLERAKLAIQDAVDRLAGDRVALAVFAGSTIVKCPLTLDYGFFRMALADVSPDSVSRGGSLVGDALRTVLRDVFDGKRSNYRDIVLITDGEDHESFPVEAAAEAGAAGARLIAIGLGDGRVGQRIPVTVDDSASASGPSGRTFLVHQGREVWTRLDAGTLRRMAEATPGGIYLNVETGAVDLGEVYSRLIASAEGAEIGTRPVERLDERFQLFLAACILLLVLETGLSERRRTAGRVAAWLLAAAMAPAATHAATVRGLVNEGNEAFRAEEYDRALRSYEQALERDPDSPYASLNRANALYRSGQFADAAEGYAEAVRQSLARDLPQLQAAGLHNLGNALYRQAERLAPTEPGRAVEMLAPAARSYLDALRADSRRIDSAQNLELARRMMQELREQARQQAGGQDGRRPDPSESEEEDSSEALQRAAEQQQELADQSEQLEADRQQQPGSDSRQEQRQRAESLAQRQDDLRDRTQELSQGAAPQARERLRDAARHQEQARQELEQGQPGAASDSQQAAADALRQAAEESRGERGEGAGQAETEGSEFAGGQPGQQAGTEQAMTMEQILAKEEQDRRRRQLMQRIGRVAVDRDW